MRLFWYGYGRLRMENEMATWIVHFRIADYFLKCLNVDKPQFTVGSVAPDCGYGKKDSMGEFEPPPKVTHWSPSGMKRDCQYEKFSKKYLDGKDKSTADYSFYLGYYVHLLTDIMWSCEIFAPTKILYAKEYKENPEFIKTIKEDWNDLDFKFLNEHPDMEVFKVFDGVGEVKQYLDYYEKEQLTIQIKFIKDYYKDGFKKHNFNREYHYLTQKKVDEFVDCACYLIHKVLKDKKLI